MMIMGKFTDNLKLAKVWPLLKGRRISLKTIDLCPCYLFYTQTLQNYFHHQLFLADCATSGD